MQWGEKVGEVEEGIEGNGEKKEKKSMNTNMRK